MNKPTQISIKHIAGAIAAFIIAIVICGFFFDVSGSTSAGIAAAVFGTMLVASTNAAYEQGKKDALADAQEKNNPS